MAKYAKNTIVTARFHVIFDFLQIASFSRDKEELISFRGQKVMVTA